MIDRAHTQDPDAPAVPVAREPMLARHAERPPAGDGWAFELKWDGVRAFVSARAGEARVLSRHGEDITHRYPELAALGPALAGHDAMLDGEIVAFDTEGRPSFQFLQRRMGLTDEGMIHRRSIEAPVTYVAFDLLARDGEPLVDEPYEERRRLLGELELDGPHWQTPRNHIGDGEALLEAVRSRGLEGIVAKKLGSPYRAGKRTADWVKVQCRRRQEVVIGGYMPGDGGRAGLVGSLLVGHWDATPAEAESLGREQRLVYAGGVGSGFTDRALAELSDALAPLRRDASPFALGPAPEEKYRQRSRERGGLVWCEPRLVCEVEFLAWTHEGTLRAASFKGLRDDKDPRDVVRESVATGSADE